MGSGLGRYTGQALNATNPLRYALIFLSHYPGRLGLREHARRDTVLIPAYSWTVLRFVTDNRKPFVDFLCILR